MMESKKAGTDLKLMRERYKAAVDADSDNRKLARDDRLFVLVPGNQWDEKQRKARRDMSDKLMQVMTSTTTVKGLRNVLAPDLHQFVPVDVEITARLPVPAVVAELKAMGMTFPEPTHGGNQ